ncbi:OCIA domain-containing protein 2 [Leptodactylus fuscus]|uniref:OCIA domain-containing protein 2 n=1 Tax=Leptodactylus fuscus TaxID=238119 RepID=UPI003F4EE297
MAADPQQDAGQSAKSTPVTEKFQMHCPISPAQREEFAKIMKESKQESFWYRALPLSITSMAVTQALIYNGYLSKNKRFGSLPKLALAGALGFVVGKISYMGTFQKKFEKLGVENPFQAGVKPGGFGPGCFTHHDKHCHHTCEECKKKCAKDKEQSTQPPANSS